MRGFLFPSVVFALAALSLPFGQALPSEVIIVAAEFQFAPAVIAVPHGTPVSFVNPVIPGASTGHTWTTAASLDDALAGNANDPSDTNCAVDGELGEDASSDTCDATLPAGSVHTITFTTAGDHHYFCQVHFVRKMVGLVTVV